MLPADCASGAVTKLQLAQSDRECNDLDRSLGFCGGRKQNSLLERVAISSLVYNARTNAKHDPVGGNPSPENRFAAASKKRPEVDPIFKQRGAHKGSNLGHTGRAFFSKTTIFKNMRKFVCSLQSWADTVISYC